MPAMHTGSAGYGLPRGRAELLGLGRERRAGQWGAGDSLLS